MARKTQYLAFAIESAHYPVILTLQLKDQGPSPQDVRERQIALLRKLIAGVRLRPHDTAFTADTCAGASPE